MRIVSGKAKLDPSRLLSRIKAAKPDYGAPDYTEDEPDAPPVKTPPEGPTAPPPPKPVPVPPKPEEAPAEDEELLTMKYPGAYQPISRAKKDPKAQEGYGDPAQYTGDPPAYLDYVERINSEIRKRGLPIEDVRDALLDVELMEYWGVAEGGDPDVPSGVQTLYQPEMPPAQVVDLLEEEFIRIYGEDLRGGAFAPTAEKTDPADQDTDNIKAAQSASSGRQNMFPRAVEVTRELARDLKDKYGGGMNEMARRIFDAYERQIQDEMRIDLGTGDPREVERKMPIIKHEYETELIRRLSEVQSDLNTLSEEDFIRKYEGAFVEGGSTVAAAKKTTYPCHRCGGLTVEGTRLVDADTAEDVRLCNDPICGEVGKSEEFAVEVEKAVSPLDRMLAGKAAVAEIDPAIVPWRFEKKAQKKTRWTRFAQVYEFTDRYDALGIPTPDPKTMCKGQCEGTGFVPIPEDDEEEPWKTLWLEAEAKDSSDDGWHFVKCPECQGTGKAEELGVAAQLDDEPEFPQDEEPAEDDYVMSDAGQLGGKTSISQYGKILGEFDSDEEAENFITGHMEQEKFWPNVWYIDDHGGTHGPLDIQKSSVEQ